MGEEKKQTMVENIREEAKDYYKGKNMVIRYIILAFLILILVLQIILPHNTNKIPEKGGNEQRISSEGDMNFSFLGEEIDFDSLDEIKLDTAIGKITSKDLSLLYKKSQYYLPEIREIFDEYDIPHEFSYLVILNDFVLPYRELSNEQRKLGAIEISDKIDERMNIKKSTEVYAKYLDELYKGFRDWRLVLLSCIMGENELVEELNFQNVDFEDLYVSNDISDKYYEVLGLSYIFQNISDYVDVKFIELYEPKNTKIIKLSETKDLKKRCNKNDYSYKEIRELNPRILGNSLPKGKREVKILK